MSELHTSLEKDIASLHRQAELDREVARPIRFILSDVDGVLTDGRINIDNEGVETKSFHVRDGMGIKQWQKSGMGFGILTARDSKVVQFRASELKIQTVRQGFSEKLPAAIEIFKELKLSPEEVCYIGDDLPDIPVLRGVGLRVAVSDAAVDVRRAASWTTRCTGGSGAVRELIERLMRAQGSWEEYLSG